MSKHFLGFGLGLRTDHYQYVIDHQPAVDWFEIISENYLVAGGKPKHYLHAIRRNYPMVMHGVSLSIGGTDPLNRDYLKALKQLADEIEPAWISDHLCWTAVDTVNSHDLMPLPYDDAAHRHVVDRLLQVQDFLGCRILLENVSSYITYERSTASEWAFYDSVVKEADCLMLLDLNNIHVSASNHRFDPLAYLRGVDWQRVRQIHLAGHNADGPFLIDTHDRPVDDPVWALYHEAAGRGGPVSTMIERDDNIPAFPELLAELDTARGIAAGYWQPETPETRRETA